MFELGIGRISIVRRGAEAVVVPEKLPKVRQEA